MPTTMRSAIARAPGRVEVQGGLEMGQSVLVLGVFLEAAPLQVGLLMMREVRLVGSVGYDREGGRADFEIALDVLARSGDLLRRELVTHRFALDEVGAAFAAAANKAAGAIKVSVRPG